MTFRDLYNSSNWNEISEYSINVESLDDLSSHSIYQENDKYYRDFYTTVNGNTTLIKVRVEVSETSSGYQVDSGYVQLAYDMDDMYITTAKMMGINPLTEVQKNRQLDLWHNYILNSADEELKKYYAESNGLVKVAYGIKTNALYAEAFFLDSVYKQIKETYNNVNNVYGYKQIEREEGSYVVINSDSDVAIINALSGNIVDGNISVNDFTADEISNFFSPLFSSDDHDIEAVKNSTIIRILFRFYGPKSGVAIITGFNIENNKIDVAANGDIIGFVTTLTAITYNISSNGLDKQRAVTITSNSNEVFKNEIWGGSFDGYGRSRTSSATLFYGPVIDSVGWTGEFKPYKVTGTVPNSEPRDVRYPGWIDVVTPVRPDPDPDPDPPIITPIPPDPDDEVDPEPPPKERKPTPEDEESEVSTSEADESDNKGVLGKIYDLGDDNINLNALSVFLYNKLNAERIAQFWKNDPTQCIASLHYLYVQPPVSGNPNIVLGDVKTNINAPEVTKRYVQINCGFRSIERLFNDARDYETRITIYLPFSGFHTLDTRLVMNSRIHVKGCVDVISGDILYRLEVDRKQSNGYYMTDKKVLYNFTGNCKVDIPYSSSSFNAGGIAGALSAAITGNYKAAIGGAVSAAAGGLFSSSSSGSLSGNTGAMGYKYPYFIIEYPKAVDIVEYGRLFGFPSHKTVKLDQVNGYAEFSAVHVDTIGNATDTEKAMIDSLLKSGVIL